ncbi:MAG TPA: head GIN domain-containing protein [Burkholderiaceae bacterium]|nr:head GIN domain-containing protein [Burkholderiaceae bacterium]
MMPARRALLFLPLLALTTRASAEVRDIPVSNFDELQWDAFGDLAIEQTGREGLTVDADPAVLAKVVIEVRQRRLRIGFTPGPLRPARPVRFRLQVADLNAVDLRGSGTIYIAALRTPRLALRMAGGASVRLARLDAERFDMRLAGSGEVSVDAGRVLVQRVAIDGAGLYEGFGLESREADASIGGSGELHLWARERLAASITGSGNIVYRGRPIVTTAVNASGSVRPDAAGDR